MVRIAVCDDVKEMLGILTEIVDKEAGKLSEPYEISGFTQGKRLVEEHNKKPLKDKDDTPPPSTGGETPDF